MARIRMLSCALAAASIGALAAPAAFAAGAPEPFDPPVPEGSHVPTEWGPRQSSRIGAEQYLVDHPDVLPWGSNDAACTSPAHPNPVILVHGTFSNTYDDFARLGPQLVDDGFCVFTFDYGKDGSHRNYANADIASSAPQIGEFVQAVRQQTGADKVDLVGYSQGALVSRWWMNQFGGAQYVDRWVGLAPSSHGTAMFGLGPIAAALPGGKTLIDLIGGVAARQQIMGSEAIAAANAGGDTRPGPHYTTIISHFDEVLNPAEQQALAPAANVTNRYIQDTCPANRGGHLRAPYDPYSIDLVREALGSKAVGTPRCETVPLGDGLNGWLYKTVLLPGYFGSSNSGSALVRAFGAGSIAAGSSDTGSAGSSGSAQR